MAPPQLDVEYERVPSSLQKLLERRPRRRIRIPRPHRPHRPRLPSQERRTDLCFLLGLAAFAGGCGWIYPPAAPIVGGAFLAAVAWIEQRGRDAEADMPATRTVERWYADGDDDEDD